MPRNGQGGDLTKYEMHIGLSVPEYTFNRTFRLTATEERVARLLVYGRTSRQIGEILNITEATARHHVERVLLKLGVSSRYEVHARAQRAHQS